MLYIYLSSVLLTTYILALQIKIRYDSTMSSSEGEEEENERAQILVKLLKRSCKELLETAQASKDPFPETLNGKGTRTIYEIYDIFNSVL